MKKIISLLWMSVLCVILVVGCGSKKETKNNESANAAGEAVTETVKTEKQATEAAAESNQTETGAVTAEVQTDIEENATEMRTESDTEEKATEAQTQSDTEEKATEAQTESDTEEKATEVQTQTVTEAEPETEAAGSDTLVVYFSATGNTKAIAEKIADGLQADIYEIVPAEPYTDADLDYHDNNSRSTLEMNDASARPTISGTVENFAQYTTVYLGYPIWWGEAPRILDTFVETYDFTGKTIIPFCTSASSGLGSSADTLKKLAGTGNWMDGKRFSGSEDASAVMDWASQF